MNLLVTDAWNVSLEQLQRIGTLGYNVIYLKNEKDSLPCDYEDVEGVVCNGLFLYHPIEKFTSLKFIQLTSAGLDRVPMDYAEKHGIRVQNARGVYSIPMAEYAISGVLEIYKNMRFFFENQKKHIWKKDRNLLELYGKNVLIVGCGSVGDECAKRFSVFGANVVGVDKFPTDKREYEYIYSLNMLDACLAKSDIVILTLPLNEDTKHLFSKDRFEKFKAGAVVVNISRGGIVDTDALVDALKDKLLGAVLDVFEEEPLDVNSPLWDMENVIVTPHNSFVGEDNADRLNKLIYKNLVSNERL